MWSRAAVLAAAMLGSGSVSHVAAGGLLPHPLVLALLGAGFTVLAGRFVLGPASTRRIVLLVVAGQAVAHTVLSVLAGHRGDPATTGRPAAAPLAPASLPTSADGHRVGSLLDAYHGGVPAAGPDSGPSVPTAAISHLVQHVVDQGPLMVAAHVAGAVALALWLAVGERALWALVNLAAARVLVAAAAYRTAQALLSALRGAASAGRPRPRAAGFRPVPRSARPALSRRGPPVLLAA